MLPRLGTTASKYHRLVSVFPGLSHHFKGYTYSVFNLVYETNTASTRIWDSLGFKRIGRVPACGNLRSSTEMVDAIIYGRDLGPDGEDIISEERFDKIRYYLKHNNYPTGADRAEKSRLRSAATHYKLVGGENGEPERLMLKGKEVISDPQNQYEIARQAHCQTHGGINKTTAMIATKYHWVRIKETVSMVIKNCTECKEAGKSHITRPDSSMNYAEPPKIPLSPSPSLPPAAQTLPQPSRAMATENHFMTQDGQMLSEHTFEHKHDPFSAHDQQNMHGHGPVPGMEDYHEMAIDPQIMQQLHSQMNSQYQHPDDAYEPTGMGHFNDAPQMHHHHTHSGEYHVDESDDHLMVQAAAAASMNLVDETHLDHEEQIPQHLLQGGYADTDGNTQFDQ
jgi:H2C2 zinc finger